MVMRSLKEIKRGNVMVAGVGWLNHPGLESMGSVSGREQSVETSSLCVHGTA